MKNLAKALLVFAITVFFLNGCTQPLEEGLPEGDQYHSTGWQDNPQHGSEFSTNPQNCRACHGEDLGGGSSGISCSDCHHGWSVTHGQAFAENPNNCKACHGVDLKGGLSGVSCAGCHHGWSGSHGQAFAENPDSCQICHGDSIASCADCHHSGWTGTHGQAFAENPSNCQACHGEDLRGGLSGVSCVPCHHSEETPNFHHGGAVAHIVPEQCVGCHGEDLSGGLTTTSCSACHPNRDKCTPCHEALQSHSVHTVASSKGPSPSLACEVCHDKNPFNYTQFADGNDLNNTAVCDNCHSPNGTYDGVSGSGGSVGAKDNWKDGVYSGGELASGKERWCAGCHDDQPANNKADGNGIYAPKVAGDDFTYGFYATGHGRHAIPLPAWPTDRIECLDCHDAGVTHIDGEARTYAFNSAYCDPAQSGVAYAEGYRLRDVDGEVPLMIPANYNITFGYDSVLMKNTAFKLCFYCHDSSKIFDDTPGDGIDSNFKASLPNPPRNYSYAWGSGGDVNEHVNHVMSYTMESWDSDWDIGTNGPGPGPGTDSMMTCSSCHNVHGSAGAEGSTNEAMIRDGSLAGRTGYGFSYVIEDTGAGGYPWVTSTDATQSTSVGAIFRNNTADNMCGGSFCHGNPDPPPGSSYDANGSSWGTYLEYYRPWATTHHGLSNCVMCHDVH